MTKYGRVLLVAVLLAGGTAWAITFEPPEALLDGNANQHGVKVFAEQQQSEKGPIDLPRPKRPPEAIPAPMSLSMESGTLGTPTAIGGAALPGARGSGTVDPVDRTERELKRLIRRLDD